MHKELKGKCKLKFTLFQKNFVNLSFSHLWFYVYVTVI